MAERKVVGRKSLMYLHSFIPVVDTQEELVRKKFKSGKFTFTVTGILKIIGNVQLLTAILIFVTNSKCEETPSWFSYLFPSVLGGQIATSLILYVIFALGLIVTNPGLWVTLVSNKEDLQLLKLHLQDIVINFVVSIITIVASVFSMLNNCNEGLRLQRIPMILGLCGSGVLVVACAALFLMYRYKEDEEEFTQPNHPVDPRKSIFA
ncbi:hypothetical protein FQA39_LY10697 [Lamprigera yunnana]|nr:hypothetical protein FQA39_LY10697 [Lamprigera yunnana]